jgi:hypothetical protein
LFNNGPVADVATVTAEKLKTLVPPAAIAVPLVQVITFAAAVQVQFAACAPPSVSAPSAILKPVGRTSTTVIVPAEAAFPVLDTVIVYVVVPPGVTAATPSVFTILKFATPTFNMAVFEESPVPD